MARLAYGNHMEDFNDNNYEKRLDYFDSKSMALYVSGFNKKNDIKFGEKVRL